MGKLHPEIEKSMGPLRRLNQMGINVPLLALRKYEQGLLPPEEKRPPVAAMEDLLIPGEYGEIPLRIITPIGEGPFPVFVFLHGGGFCSGSYGEILARSIAGICQVVVVSVNYRLAPENKFPIPLSDCYTASKWASDNIDRIGGTGTSLFIGGDSAGGNLSIATAMLNRERKDFVLAKMVLMYPMTDYLGKQKETPYYSKKNFGKKYLLTTKHLYEAQEHYMRDTYDMDNPYIFPMKAKELFGFPPTMVLTSEFDPLRDEGEAFAEKLKRDGVPVKLVRCEGMIHAFMERTELDIVKEAYRLVSDFLSKQPEIIKEEGTDSWKTTLTY